MDGRGLIASEDQMTDNGNMKAAEQTYDGFLSFLKWGTIVTTVVTILVIIAIT